jgi:hypothetical protein
VPGARDSHVTGVAAVFARLAPAEPLLEPLDLGLNALALASRLALRGAVQARARDRRPRVQPRVNHVHVAAANEGCCVRTTLGKRISAIAV